MAEYTPKQVQISAFIAEETKTRLDRYVAETGMKKSAVIDEAVRRHLDALEEIPAEMMVEADLVLTPESYATVLDLIENPHGPTPELIELMRDYRKFMAADGD